MKHHQLRNIIVTLSLIVIFIQGCNCCQRKDGFSLFTCKSKELLPDLPGDVTAQRVKELLDQYKGYTYLDVRTQVEFAEGHVPGSINIPVMIRDSQKKMMLNDDFLSAVQRTIREDADLIVGCRSGHRSGIAQGIMQKAGYQKVTNMLGGFYGKKSKDGEVIHPGWSMLGYPTESGSD